MTENYRRIVVTGIGVVSPYGVGLDVFEGGLLRGDCRLQPSTGFYPGFSGTIAQVSGLPPLEELPHFHSSRTDHYAVAASREAIASSGIGEEHIPGIGVIMATTVAGLTEIDTGIVKDPAAWYREGGLSRAASYPVAHVADAIGEYLGLHGPRIAVTVACASGAISMALAAHMLLDGEADFMLAGGSDALCPFTLSGFSSLKALDAGPCRPFDQRREGLNLGEGAAALVLETLEGAAQRHAPVFAELRGWAIGNDAFHQTAPHPEGRGLAACMASAMEMAGVKPDEIGYVNAHGTGTPLNDAAETKAYESAFRSRNRPIPVSSTKSYFGHCLGAAGALEAAVTICGIRRGALFPTLRLSEPIDSPAVDWLMGGPRRVSVPIAMTVSAGFGGSNAVLIFSGEGAGA
jgi:3-oxoacyl-[acyl-carrier-protein] synthase II